VAVAGATDLWVNIRSGKLKPEAVVSLRGIAGLDALTPIFADGARGAAGAGGGAAGGGGLTIGAMTPHGKVEDSLWVAAHFPALQQGCAGLGSRQVRNVGTVGGNICNAAPCADSATSLMLFDATLVIQGPGGLRELPLGEFFVGPGMTRLLSGEVLKEIRVPDPGANTFSRYIKHTRRRGVELAMMSVGVRVTLDDDLTTVKTARISLGVCAPTPTCAVRAQDMLVGKPLTREAVEAAALVAAEDSKVRDSWRGKAWYRREMIRVLVPRAVEQSGAFAAAGLAPAPGGQAVPGGAGASGSAGRGGGGSTSGGAAERGA
jgi:CO/xanthine dehydrogenase FAD-binding subunit